MKGDTTPPTYNAYVVLSGSMEPNIKVNDLDNLGKFNGEIQDGTVSIATFQALDNLWYKLL